MFLHDAATGWTRAPNPCLYLLHLHFCGPSLFGTLIIETGDGLVCTAASAPHLPPTMTSRLLALCERVLKVTTLIFVQFAAS